MNSIQNEDDEKDVADKLSIVRFIWNLSLAEFLGAVHEFFTDWRTSRNWSQIALILPPVCILIAVVSVASYGIIVSRNSLSSIYAKRALELIELQNSEVKDSILDGETKSFTGDEVVLLFRRVLSLGYDSDDAHYFVAEQNLRTGKIRAARSIFQKLAPKDKVGYLKAHAWLAFDILQKVQRSATVEDLAELRHHLEASCRNTDLKLNPILYVTLAKLVLSDNKIDECIELLMRAGEVDPRFQMEALMFCAQRQLVSQSKWCADRLISRLKVNLDKLELSESDKVRDVLAIAQAYQMTGRTDESILILNNVLAINKSPELKRSLSDAYRIKFRMSLAQRPGQVQVNMDFLNMAIAADPTNLSVQSELSTLSAMGIVSDPANRELLRDTIAANGASFAARLLLAEAAIVQSDWKNAVAHYEVIVAEHPDMTLALNNLAMVYTKLDPPNFDAARTAIQKAIEVSPKSHEFLDTLGDVEIAASNTERARENYLKAVEINPQARSTRVKLIRMYEAENDSENAKIHHEAIEKIDARIKAIQEANKLQSAERAQRTQPLPQTATPGNTTSTNNEEPAAANEIAPTELSVEPLPVSQPLESTQSNSTPPDTNTPATPELPPTESKPT